LCRTGFVGILIQLFSLTCTAPLFFFLTLVTSPASSPDPAKEFLRIESHDLAALFDTVILSYFVPTVLMSLNNPAWISTVNHQRLIALWQIFPIFTTSIHYYLTNFWFSKEDQQLTGNYHFDALSTRPYLLATSAVSFILPILMSLYHGNFIESFVPYSLQYSSSTPVPNLATGVKNFLQWDIYIASLSFIVWAALLYWEGRVKLDWKARKVQLLPMWKLLGLCVVGGPISAALLLQQEREKMVFEPIDGYVKILD
jgi:hypothetical protein